MSPPQALLRRPSPGRRRPGTGNLISEMAFQPDQVDELLSPGYMDSIEQAPIAELRSKRDDCQRAEVALSYVRRVLQGQLDIIKAETERRVEGGDEGAAELIDRLPEILSTARAQRSAAPHPPIATMPGVAAGMSEAFDVELSTIGPDDVSSSIGNLTDPELETAARHILATEAQVSARRGALHELIDQLQGEIVERYKSGEADVDSLLRQGRAGAD